MSIKPRRTIEWACFDKGIGLVHVQDLIEMAEDEWGHLRDEITDKRSGKEEGLRAQCFRCGGDVFIRNTLGLPGFVHFQGSDPSCEWYEGDNANPDSIRAAQYQGQQESPAHKFLCSEIASLARLDSRCNTEPQIGKYLKSTVGEGGRYPDVLVEWDGFKKMVFEVQLSNTFQSEISARSVHYQQEAVALIWVLYKFPHDANLIAQNFRDVIRRHRGNAFVIDRESIAQSKIEKTIVLKCYLKNPNDESFAESKLVRVDSLQFPEIGSPFLEDRVAQPILDKGHRARKPWISALDALHGNLDEYVCEIPEIRKLIQELRSANGGALARCFSLPTENYKIIRLIATLLSISESTKNLTQNFASQQPNLKAMLNSFLYGGYGKRYANMIEHFLRSSPHASMLHDKESVAQHIQRAKQSRIIRQCVAGDAEWKLGEYLFPEIFNAIVRNHLEDLGALPIWAQAPGVR